MKKVLTILFVALSFMSNAQFKNINEAINVAGKQRMLSQKITKSFLLISADVNPEKYQNELDNDIALFEEAHQMLREYCEGKEDVNVVMNEVEEVWFNFREMAMSTEYTKTECSYLLSNAANLLKLTNNVVNLLEKGASSTGDKKTVKIVNISGRQRMLSQKIGMYYLAAYLELPAPEIKPKFEEATKLFDESLASLLAEKDLNTAEISKKLTSVNRNWNFVKRSLKLEGKLKPATVAVSLNSLLRDMNAITGMYANL